MRGGTGIGLALSKELVELMGGQISVESEWGKGITFGVRLPAKKATGDAGLATRGRVVGKATMSDIFAKADDIPAGDKTKILIVEDNPEMQLLIQNILNTQYDCLVSPHGAAAWALLEKEAPEVADINLILSDGMMPEMDGYTLLEKIKGHPRWQGLPVVMLTARSAEEDKLRALRMGVDDYLMKPVRHGS